MKLDKIFRTAVEYKASDIYITSGNRPVLRVNGDITIIEDHPVITPDMAKEFIDRLNTIDGVMDVDTSYEFGKKEIKVIVDEEIKAEIARRPKNSYWLVPEK